MSKFHRRKQSSSPRPATLRLGGWAPRKFHDVIRKIYNNGRWIVYLLASGGKAGIICNISPKEIVLGQLPSSQFPRRARRYVQGGNWDTEVIAIEDHSVYRSMVDHFVKSLPWENTMHYKEAEKRINADGDFRGCNFSRGDLALVRKMGPVVP